VVVLCHKPYQLEPVAREISGRARIVASVVGGTRVAQLERSYPNTPVFSLIPNTPVEVRKGIICYARQDEPHEHEGEVLELFRRLGAVIELPERLLEAAAAIASVGPAYQALLVEAQVDAGVRYGLGARLASELVVGTMAGTAALLEQRDYDTLALRREVASPGGTTVRGLAALERHGVRTAFQAAIDAVRGST
jgi:pyrroline-5-carboxylate reductase